MVDMFAVGESGPLYGNISIIAGLGEDLKVSFRVGLRFTVQLP